MKNNMRLFLCLLFLFSIFHFPFSIAPARADAPEVVRFSVEDGGVDASSPFTPERLDSVLHIVRGERNVEAFERFFHDFIQIDSTATLTSDVPDSVYERRLKSILSPI